MVVENRTPHSAEAPWFAWERIAAWIHWTGSTGLGQSFRSTVVVCGCFVVDISGLRCVLNCGVSAVTNHHVPPDESDRVTTAGVRVGQGHRDSGAEFAEDGLARFYICVCLQQDREVVR